VSSERPSLGELARAARVACDARDTGKMRRVLSRLRGDPRAGGRRLAAQLERHLAAFAAERRRLRRLFALRARLYAAGARAVAGVDEVGVGPLAGPVVAAAVILADRAFLPGLDDSKRLTRGARERLAGAIREQAVAWCVAEASPSEIDRLNIYRATLVAMRRAVLGLGVVPDHVLVDARKIPDLAMEQTPIIGGDARDGSIAAASIVAKVHRDAQMHELDSRYPGYGLARHKGYATEQHRRALARLGPSPVHRRSFAPCSQTALW